MASYQMLHRSSLATMRPEDEGVEASIPPEVIQDCHVGKPRENKEEFRFFIVLTYPVRYLIYIY